MFKVAVLLAKRADLSHDEFVEYWEESHAPLVEELPDVERYSMSIPGQPEDSAYDGVAELYFEDFSTMRDAYATDAGEELRADAAEFADMSASETLFLDETVAFETE